MTVCFGPYRLDAREARLTRDGEAVVLRPKAFELLVALVREPNVLVTKDELLDRVWGTRFVTEGVVKSIVGELRDALGDDARTPRWIETVPRRGYRFVGAVDAGDAGPAPASAADGNVPPSQTAPIGRDEALRVATALHDTHRLLTIAGPSGVGKTRLALALAASRRDAWRDGVWFVELASMATGSTDVGALSARLAQLLRLDATAGADAANLARGIRSLELLLVLDNAEHLLEPVATLVDALLAGAPAARIVVTSQEPLGLADEQVYRVAPLSLPRPEDDADGRRLMESSAVQLFVERVAGRVQGFALAADQQGAVAAICRALDGVPLAIELAAARVPLLGVHGVADLLPGDDHDARLHLLTGGARTAAPRQRTLRDAIAWSYALLDARQRAVLRRLGVFRGGFSLAAAQAVCGDDTMDAWFVLDAMNALVDKSLVVSIDGSGERRFRLLESLRTFARERLVEAGEEAATRDRHLVAIADYWSRADDQALVHPSLVWTERHLVELDNLRAALRWADSRGDGRTLRALVAYTSHLWCRSGLGGEGRRWCESARAHAASSADPVLDARFELAIATLALYANAYRADEVVGTLPGVVDALDAMEDPARAYFALYLLFQLALRCRAATDGAAVLARMRSLERPAWNDVLKRFLRNAAGYAQRLAGDASGYRTFCRDELVLCRRIGALAESWIAAQGLMLAELDMGRTADAVVIADEAVDEIRSAGRLRQYPAFVALRATMLAEGGDVARARAALVETLPVLDGAGTRWMADVALGWLAAHDGRDDDAARVFGRHRAAVESGSASGSGVYVARVLDALRERLTRTLGVDAFERRCAEGSALDDRQVERLAMGGEQADRRTPSVGTGR